MLVLMEIVFMVGAANILKLSKIILVCGLLAFHYLYFLFTLFVNRDAETKSSNKPTNKKNNSEVRIHRYSFSKPNPQWERMLVIYMLYAIGIKFLIYLKHGDKLKQPIIVLKKTIRDIAMDSTGIFFNVKMPLSQDDLY